MNRDTFSTKREHDLGANKFKQELTPDDSTSKKFDQCLSLSRVLVVDHFKRQLGTTLGRHGSFTHLYDLAPQIYQLIPSGRIALPLLRRCDRLCHGCPVLFCRWLCFFIIFRSTSLALRYLAFICIDPKAFLELAHGPALPHSFLFFRGWAYLLLWRRTIWIAPLHGTSRGHLIASRDFVGTARDRLL